MLFFFFFFFNMLLCCTLTFTINFYRTHWLPPVMLLQRKLITINKMIDSWKYLLNVAVFARDHEGYTWKCCVERFFCLSWTCWALCTSRIWNMWVSDLVFCLTCTARITLSLPHILIVDQCCISLPESVVLKTKSFCKCDLYILFSPLRCFPFGQLKCSTPHIGLNTYFWGEW